MEGSAATLRYVALTPAEIAETERVLMALFEGRPSTDLDSLMRQAHVAAQELPKRVRRALYELKLNEDALAVCIRNGPVDDQRIGPTPTSLRSPGQAERATPEEALHILYASLLGEPFTWNTIQSGYLINDVIPVPADEAKPLSSGSANPFGLHTEDAFNPLAGDFLGLMCLRNPDRVSTVISTVLPGVLPEKALSILSQSRFIVGANLAHTVHRSADRVPILFGNMTQPYIRINLNVSAQVDDDEDARWALDLLAKHLENNARDIVLVSGDCFFLDNFRAPHGRRAFSPRYDGTDRWLKRLYITSSLRASRHLRAQTASRLVILDEQSPQVHQP